MKRLFGQIAIWSGKGVSFLTLLMVGLMFLSTMLSNLFRVNAIALQESATWLHAIVFMLGAAYTLQKDEHVRVDIFYRRWSLKKQAIVNSVGTLFFLLPTCVFIIYSSWPYVTLSWRLSEASAEVGGLPGLYLLKTIILVMPILLIIEGLHQLMIHCDVWKNGSASPDATHQNNRVK